MKHEIECKLRLSAEIDEKINSLGAEYHGKVYEQNWVFDKGGELADKRQLLRLRVIDNAKTGIITHKAPASDEKEYKKRIETEVVVDNADNTRHIFEALGYTVDWYYEKFRQSWELEGCEIVVDTMPHIGQFIEIEADSEQSITDIIQRLGLDHNDNSKLSYRQIWFEHCQQNNLDFGDWRFTDNNAQKV